MSEFDLLVKTMEFVDAALARKPDEINAEKKGHKDCQHFESMECNGPGSQGARRLKIPSAMQCKWPECQDAPVVPGHTATEGNL